MIAGTLLGLASAALWACANVAIQVSSRRFGSFGALVWAQVIGGLLVALAALVVEGPPVIPDARSLCIVLLAGVCAAVAYSALFESLRRGQVAVVSPVIAGWSVVAVAIGVGVFDDPLSLWAAAGVLAVVAGNATLARSAGAGGETPASALAVAGLSALGFGVMVGAVEVAGESVGRIWIVPMVWATELAIFVPLLLVTGRLERRPRGAADWLVAARVAVFEAGGFVALSVGLAVAPVTLVSPVSSLSTAFSVALGVLLLSERVPRAALLGAALVSAGVVLVNF